MGFLIGQVFLLATFIKNVSSSTSHKNLLMSVLTSLQEFKKTPTSKFIYEPQIFGYASIPININFSMLCYILGHDGHNSHS